MAPTELYAANRAVTTVSSGGTTAPSGGTTETWTVASSALFGAAATGVSQFHVADPAAPSEIIAVTNVSGTTWTVTRGAESTTPVTHSAGFTVYQVVTAGALGGMLQSADNLSDVASASSARTNLGLGSAATIATPVSTGNGGTGSATRNFAGLLTPTAVKITTYSAAAGDYVPCDTTSGSFTVTLPSAPADLTVVGVKQITRGSANTVTVACAGSDVFNKTGGATSATLTLLAQGLLLQYKASGAIWYVLADDLPLSQLDLRYAAPASAASSRSLPLYLVPPPSGDTTGTTDTANISAVENAATTAGGTLTFAPGTYYTTGLTKQASTIWQGSGRLATIIQLANGANADVIQGANFTTLTLSGSASGGIGGWSLRDLTIDGNASHQAGTSYGLRVYGYNFSLRNVSIRNTLTDGMYTEWANFGGASIPDGTMNASYQDVRIHDTGGHGWHNRGPHDSKVLGVTFSNVGASSYGYWAEANNATTVASGSNGVSVATFAGSGTLNVATTLGWNTASISATQGAISVVTSGVTAVITYTGVTATSFTGCTTVSGTGTLATGNAVAPVGAFSAAAVNIWGMHTSGNPPAWGYVLDTETHLTDCTAEAGSTGMFLIRGSGCQVIGGEGIIYAGLTQQGLGIQLGDAANAVSGALIVAKVSGLSNAGASSCSLNIVSDGGSNDVTLAVYAPSGSNTTVISGTPSGVSRYQVHAAGATASVNAVNSLVQDNGPVQLTVPASATNAWRLTAGTTDLVNFNSTTPRISWPNGITHNWYSDAYTTLKASVSGATGAASFQSAALNGGKVTGLGNGTAATDGTALGQLPPADLSTAPSGATAQTFPRALTTATCATLTSGILYVRLIPVQIGTVVSNITFMTGTTVKAGGTHGWYVLLDNTLKVVAVTADQTDASTVWGSASTFYTLPVTAPYTATYSGYFYIGVMVTESAGTMPTFNGATGVLTGVSGAAPILSGTSSTGQTTPPAVGATMTTVSSSGNYQFYAYTS